MALLDLSFTDGALVESDARPFSCAVCTEDVAALRRCAEDRYDFGHADGSAFPVQMTPSGFNHGFCPAKATWDEEAVRLYRLLVLAADTGRLWEAGELRDQPEWWVDLAGWFIPLLHEVRFSSRARSFLGGKDATAAGATKGKGQKHAGHPGRSPNKR